MSAEAFPALGQTLAPRRFGPITPAQVAAFARASGDDNPIHLDDAAARRAGLDRPAVHGMQLVALLHAAAAGLRPGLVVEALATRFLAPVAVGDTVEVTGRVVQVAAASGRPRAILRLFLRDGAGTLASLGEATLLAADAP